MTLKVSYLLSTTFEREECLERALFDLTMQSYSHVEIIVLIQNQQEIIEKSLLKIKSKLPDSSLCRFIFSDAFGLCKSRNLALAEASGDICIFCDDDCRYPKDSAEKIANAFNLFPNWDIITFQCNNLDKGIPLKKYPAKATLHNQISLLKVNSITIAIRRRIYEQQGELFDNSIGLGTSIISGAENIMLFELMRKGYRLGYFPEVIVSHPDDSSRRSFSNMDKLLFAQGYTYARIFGKKSIFLITMFILKRRISGQKKYFSISGVKHMFDGYLLGLRG